MLLLLHVLQQVGLLVPVRVARWVLLPLLLLRLVVRLLVLLHVLLLLRMVVRLLVLLQVLE